MAVAATRLDSEHVGVMHALGVLLEGGTHFVAGRAERVGFGIFEAADKASCESDSEDERNEPSSRYSEEEPALGAPPKPCCDTLGLWRWLQRHHVDSIVAVTLAAQIEQAVGIYRGCESGMDSPYSIRTPKVDLGPHPPLGIACTRLAVLGSVR